MVEPSAFGQRVRQLRRAAGLTQEELAARAGMSLRGLQDLELGTRRVPHIDTARRLIDALDLPEPERAAVLALRRLPNGTNASSAATPLVAADKDEFVGKLPIPLTSFVGRERQLTELAGLFEKSRLLTLTGMGGIGKTRLALQLAREVEADYRGGAKLVELAPLVDPSLVTQAVASALDVEEQPGQPLRQTLLAALRSRHVMLVLDNCEHLVQACAELAEAVLRTCPEVRILATSREPLGVTGEVIWRVPPLEARPVDTRLCVEDLARSDAVRLFVQRAALARPTFRLAQDNATAVAQICQRLEGIPLAIELAAARVSALSVHQISARLADSLGLLTSTSRTAPTRQRTLRATIDWSYGLLTEGERLLFDRLAVFAGGWSLEAAESICAGDGLAAEAVLDLLTRLIDKSLVIADERSGSARYVLLDTLRAYAWESLEASGAATEIQRRHRDWYVRLAESFDAEWHGARQRAWLDELEREESNLRNALCGCVNRSESTEGLRLAASLYMFWDVRGRLAEGRAWLSQLLDMADASLPRLVHAKALYALAHVVTSQQGADAGAEIRLEESLALCRGLDARQEIATTFRLAAVARLRGDDTRASALCAQMLALAQHVGDRVGTYLALSQLAMIAIQQGEYARALELGEQSLLLKRQQGDALSIGVSLRTLAELAWLGGDAKRAADRLREGLTLHGNLRNRRGIADCLELLAEINGARGESDRAMRLYGASDALRQATGARRTGVPRMDPARREATIAAARARLSAAEFEQAWSEGGHMSLEETMRCALEPFDESGEPRGQTVSTTTTG